MTDHSEYCRTIETHLCQKNDGHLIRIVGPVFEQVCGWAERGVPLAIALGGIDRYCERYYAKGPRRRPVRVEFCEADILDLFDDWRRAVGVPAASAAAEEPRSRRPVLAAHIERAIARLIGTRAGGIGSETLARHIDAVIRELDVLAGEARHARGDARSRVVDRLAALDLDLQATGAAAIDATQAEALGREADAELAPFGSRMSPEARERAAAAAFRRLVREALGLPSLVYE